MALCLPIPLGVGIAWVKGGAAFDPDSLACRLDVEAPLCRHPLAKWAYSIGIGLAPFFLGVACPQSLRGMGWESAPSLSTKPPGFLLSVFVPFRSNEVETVLGKVSKSGRSVSVPFRGNEVETR